MLIRRLTSQANQASIFIQALFGLESQQSNQRADLVRDKFGLHKMIVAVTSPGKVRNCVNILQVHEKEYELSRFVDSKIICFADFWH